MIRRWLDRRLGGAGPGRQRVLAAVRGRLISTSIPDTDASAPLIPQAELAGASTCLPERGGPERLAEVGAWGAAICALTLRDGAPDSERRALLGAAARFNVAVALFDTVVDGRPRDLPPLARALSPDRLRTRLLAPEGRSLVDPQLPAAPIAMLFDAAICAAGRFWRDSPDHLALLGDLLERMYASELGRSRDRRAAKELPVVFLGALGTDKPEDVALHRALGGFIASWDDWLDQADDLMQWRANVFLGEPDDGLGLLAFGGRAVLRIAAGPQRSVVASSLADAAADVIAAARAAGPEAERRVQSLLAKLAA